MPGSRESHMLLKARPAMLGSRENYVTQASSKLYGEVAIRFCMTSPKSIRHSTIADDKKQDVPHPLVAITMVQRIQVAHCLSEISDALVWRTSRSLAGRLEIYERLVSVVLLTLSKRRVVVEFANQ